MAYKVVTRMLHGRYNDVTGRYTDVIGTLYGHYNVIRLLHARYTDVTAFSQIGYVQKNQERAFAEVSEAPQARTTASKKA